MQRIFTLFFFFSCTVFCLSRTEPGTNRYWMKRICIGHLYKRIIMDYLLILLLPRKGNLSLSCWKWKLHFPLILNSMLKTWSEGDGIYILGYTRIIRLFTCECTHDTIIHTILSHTCIWRVKTPICKQKNLGVQN